MFFKVFAARSTASRAASSQLFSDWARTSMTFTTSDISTSSKLDPIPRGVAGNESKAPDEPRRGNAAARAFRGELLKMGCWHQAKTGWKRYGRGVGLAGAFRTECRIDRQLGGARLRAVFEGASKLPRLRFFC